jgi:general transcription factor 3C polypeptide 3 (transcription factor C subunit 4)
MSRQMRFCGAHVDPEGEAWVGLAGEFRYVGKRNHGYSSCRTGSEIEDTNSYIYCLRKAVSVDPSDANSLYELASVFKAQNSTSHVRHLMIHPCVAYITTLQAIYSFKRLLRNHAPSAYNFALIAEFLPLLQSTAAIQTYASEILLTAFNYHLAKIPSSSSLESTLTLEHVITLTDLLLRLDDLEEALAVVRRGQRWLQGRGDQRSWDGFDDDREYHPPGFSKEDDEGGIEDFEGFGMEVDLRHRLALIRLRMGNDDDATVSPLSMLGRSALS